MLENINETNSKKTKQYSLRTIGKPKIKILLLVNHQRFKKRCIFNESMTMVESRAWTVDI